MDTTYRLFASLLDYPTEDLGRHARECLDALLGARSPAAGPLNRFSDHLRGASQARIEELYTRTFDLQAVCSPYVGYQLFGDSYKRGLFMARLNEGYREKGFSPGSELPDHIAVVLRFLALGPEDEFSRALLDEGLVPALDKMRQTLERSSDNPYSEVIAALWLALGKSERTGVDDA